MARILLIEDEDNIRKIIAYDLKKADFDIVECGDGRTAVDLAMKEDFDVLIIDWMLPHVSGIDIVKKLRSEHIDAIFIMLTARDDETDILYAFEQGVDDYITKPFTPMELLARVNSHLRRYHRFLDRLSSKQAENPRIHRLGGLEVNEETVEVMVDDKPVKVTPIEFKILLLLIQNPGRVFPAEEIYERVWNERAINTDTVMVHIRNLREKIEVNPREPKYVKVVWGVGYKIEKQP